MSKFKNQNQNIKAKNDLRNWSFKFSLQVIKFIKFLPNNRMYWTIGDQLLHSATSIGANIIEAKSSSSKREFIKFYEIALKSANETRYWLYLLKESGLVKESRLVDLIRESEEIAKMLGASIITLKGKRKL